MKIPCYILIYRNFERNKESLDFFIKYNDKLDITIIENKSDYTYTLFKPYIDELVKTNKIKRYVIFDENIASNAFGEIIEHDLSELNQYDMIMITDGDIISEDNNWIEEEINIVNNNPEVLCCGMPLSMVNFPKIPEFQKNKPPESSIISGKDYYEGDLGWCALLFTMDKFLESYTWVKRYFKIFLDGYFQLFCLLSHYKFARTKNALAYHLTWDDYSYPDKNEYGKWKLSLSYKEIWLKKQTSSFTIYTNKNCVFYAKPLLTRMEKIFNFDKQKLNGFFSSYLLNHLLVIKVIDRPHLWQAFVKMILIKIL